MSETKRISIAYGDGIGPSIMEAAMSVLEASKAKLAYDEVEIGEKVYLSGHSSGLTSETWDTLIKNQVFFKAPITTPQGGGYKSLNVTIRKTLGLFANVRPVMSYPSVVQTKHSAFDMVIVRENEEDLYAGIEHRQTDEVYQCLKLISEPGSERIIRYAFEYAKNNGRKKVTCFVKDNIMKMTDGIFHKVFDRIAKEYPEIENEHYIVDIGAARLADTPERFDVVVMQNLYGDIISDVAAQISGSVGLCGSSNIGETFSMFEAIHGSAPDIAGKNIANPSGLINASMIMLGHIGQGEAAKEIHNAWLKTLEDGIHTVDIYNESRSKHKVGTQDFAKAVIDRLGSKPEKLAESQYTSSKIIHIPAFKKISVKKELVGVDVFLCDANKNASEVGDRLKRETEGSGFELEVITNRGIKVWPDPMGTAFCTDHWRCRFMKKNPDMKIWQLLDHLDQKKFEVIKTENLYNFDGERGYSQAQGK